MRFCKFELWEETGNDLNCVEWGRMKSSLTGLRIQFSSLISLKHHVRKRDLKTVNAGLSETVCREGVCEEKTSKQRGRPSTHPQNRTLHAAQNHLYSFTDKKQRGEWEFTRTCSLMERKKRSQTRQIIWHQSAVIDAKGQDLIYETLLFYELKQIQGIV